MRAYLRLVVDEESKLTGDRIRSARNRKSWSQKDLADKAGVTRQTVSGWENGGGIKAEHLNRVAPLLGMTPRELGRPYDPESPRPRRLTEQQSHNPPSHPHVAAPPQPSIGVVMGPGEQALFDQIVGVWMLCRDEEERRSLVEHVRSFVEHPAERRPKKAAR